MHWDVFLACTAGGEGFNVKTLVMLSTTITLYGLRDILEGMDVLRSWQEAARKNAEDEHGRRPR